MSSHKLNTLLFINTQQSVFNYFYKHNKAHLDGEFAEPKSKSKTCSLNVSTASSCFEEESEPAVDSQAQAQAEADKTPLRRAKTLADEPAPSLRSRSLKPAFTHN